MEWKHTSKRVDQTIYIFPWKQDNLFVLTHDSLRPIRLEIFWEAFGLRRIWSRDQSSYIPENFNTLFISYLTVTKKGQMNRILGSNHRHLRLWIFLIIKTYPTPNNECIITCTCRYRVLFSKRKKLWCQVPVV